MHRFAAGFATILSVLVLAWLAGPGCSSDDGADQPDQQIATTTEEKQPATTKDTSSIPVINKAYEPVDEKWDLNGTRVTVGGLIFTPASQWTDHGVQGKKAAFYTYGPLKDDPYPSRLAVYYVPYDEAADYLDYFAIWLERMEYSHLKDPTSAAIRHDREADSMTVHVQSLFGGYYPEAEEHVEGEILPRDPYRMLGVVVEAPDGLVLFELSGPDYTARVMIEAFMNGIYGLRRS